MFKRKPRVRDVLNTTSYRHSDEHSQALDDSFPRFTQTDSQATISSNYKDSQGHDSNYQLDKANETEALPTAKGGTWKSLCNFLSNNNKAQTIDEVSLRSLRSRSSESGYQSINNKPRASGIKPFSGNDNFSFGGLTSSQCLMLTEIHATVKLQNESMNETLGHILDKQNKLIDSVNQNYQNLEKDTKQIKELLKSKGNMKNDMNLKKNLQEMKNAIKQLPNKHSRDNSQVKEALLKISEKISENNHEISKISKSLENQGGPQNTSPKILNKPKMKLCPPKDTSTKKLSNKNDKRKISGTETDLDNENGSTFSEISFYKPVLHVDSVKGNAYPFEKTTNMKSYISCEYRGQRAKKQKEYSIFDSDDWI